MGLNATVRKFLTKNPGSSAIDTARVRNAAQVTPTDIANTATSLQRQIDAVVSAGLADQPLDDPITVSGSDGSEIGWIGTRVVSAVSYLGMWFKNFWLGGSDPATAQIYSDSIGNVVINGATFSLNRNGVTTTINNATSAVGVLSIKSLDNASSYWTGMTPLGIDLLDNLGNSLGYLRSNGGSGHISLANVAGTNTITLITGGGGAPKISATGGAGTVAVSPSVPLDVFGFAVVDSSRVVTGTDVVTPKLNGGTIPTSGVAALNGTQQLTNASAGTGISIAGATISNTGVLSVTNGDAYIGVTGTSAVSITNLGVTQVYGGSGISVDASTGNVTFTNDGVTDITAGTGISVSAPSGSISITNTAPFPAGGFTGSILLIGPTTNGSITVVNGIITAAVDPT